MRIPYYKVRGTATLTLKHSQRLIALSNNTSVILQSGQIARIGL